MKDFLKGIVFALAISAFAFVGTFTEQNIIPHASAPLTSAAPAFGNFNPTGGGTYYLSSTISSSQTTIRLSSFTEPTSGTLYTMAYLNSSIEYATIAPQTSQSEFVSFTGITQNSDGSATLTGVVRGLSRSYPYTASATFALPHAGQSRFILSDSPQVFNQYAILQNANTWSAVQTFGSTTPPKYDADPIWANFSTQVFADVAYVNSVVAAGAANASETVKGIIQLATGAQAALGTSLGSTGARLAIGNNLATSTPYNSGTNVVPITGTNEKISQLFLDLTQAFSFSGLVTSTNGLTSTATTTLTGNNVNSNAIVLNTLPYAFSSIRGASSTVPYEDGSGNIRFESLPYTSLGSGSLSSGTTTIVIPAGTMVGNNRIAIQWSFLSVSSGVDLVQIGSGVASSTVQSGTAGGTCSNVNCLGSIIFANETTGSNNQIWYGYTAPSGTAITASVTETTFTATNPIYVSFGITAGTGRFGNYSVQLFK